MNLYYFWISFFAILAYFIVTDNSFSTFIVLISKIFRVWYEKTKWWILHNPSNPIVKFIIWRKSIKLAEELLKEYNLKSSDDN